MKHKKTLLTSLMMTLLTVACLFMFSACDMLNGLFGGLFGGGTTYTVTWDVDENATLTVEGEDELPTEVAEGTQLTVTVDPADGYEVNKFYVGTNNINANSDGKYVFKVNMDVTIKVTMTEAISAVNVTSNPTKLSYYAGEEVDKTGMEVEIEYATGRKDVTDKYVVRYTNGTAFGIGDTSFEVVLTSKTSIKTTVELNEAVVAKVVIDPVGGTIADEYYAMLEGNTEIANLAKDANGAISFTHAQPLTAEIALPSAEQVAKGEGDDYVFQGWSGAIAAGNATSLNIAANYQANLIVVNAIGYELRENVPYLVINGEFKAAESAYLYLFEGNDIVELNGPEVNGTRGDAFELLFDMRGLVAEDENGTQTYIGKWMDIKFQAQFGDRVETQEINLNDYAEDFCDINEVIRYDGYEYGFKVHTPDGTDQRNLKAVASTYFDNSYTLGSYVDADNNVILTINGKIGVSEYYGKAVTIDFWVTETLAATAPIDENGNYTVELNLSAAALDTTGYAHFKIVESVDDSTELFRDGTDGNLLNSWCVNEDLNSEYNGIGLITGGAIRCAREDNSQVFYVGAGTWGGVVLYGRVEGDTKVEFNGVSLKEVDGKVYYVVKGIAGGAYYGEGAKELKLAAHFQHNANIDSTGSWSSVLVYADNNNKTTDLTEETVILPAVVATVAEDGAFEALFEITSFEIGWGLTVHAGLDGAMTDYKHGNGDGVSVVVDGKKFSILCNSSTWDISAVQVTEAGLPELTLASASLAVKDNVAYVVLNGTWNAGEVTLDAAKVATAEWAFDLQHYSSWEYIYPAAEIVVNEDGTFTVSMALTDATAHETNPWYMHFNGSNVELVVEGEASVTAGGKTYTIAKGSSVDTWTGNLTVIIVTEA